ncbi:Uncharacterised protein [Aquipseudomonas alcaligenes]|nr:Uncharacterised protein [Pseudomonas alcaligenes]
MTIDTLKPRAKRLRAAVAQMLKVSITHSQALELVAKEENYPNWDAACASVRHQLKKSGSSVAKEHSIQVTVQGAQEPTFSSIFDGNQNVATDLIRVLDMSCGRGALVVIAGFGIEGKTTTANAVMEWLAAANHQHASDIKGQANYRLFDEIRDEATAFQAVALAEAGVKVVATIHAKQGYGLERVRSYLRSYGAGEMLLDRLSANGLALTIHQELVWSDPSVRNQLVQQRRDELATILKSILRHEPVIANNPTTP